MLSALGAVAHRVIQPLSLTSRKTALDLKIERLVNEDCLYLTPPDCRENKEGKIEWILGFGRSCPAHFLRDGCHVKVTMDPKGKPVVKVDGRNDISLLGYDEKTKDEIIQFCVSTLLAVRSKGFFAGKGPSEKIVENSWRMHGEIAVAHTKRAVEIADQRVKDYEKRFGPYRYSDPSIDDDFPEQTK